MWKERYLLHVAFEAARFLEQGLPSEVTDHVTAIDPDVSNGQPFVFIHSEMGAISKLLPVEMDTLGHRVQVICRSTAKLEVH